MTHSIPSTKNVPTAASAYSPTPDARPIDSVDNITPASFGIVDLGAVPDQARGADDPERARQARADDEHHDRADDGEDHLRLDDRRRCAGGVPRRRGRNASTAPSTAAIGRLTSAVRVDSSCSCRFQCAGLSAACRRPAGCSGCACCCAAADRRDRACSSSTTTIHARAITTRSPFGASVCSACPSAIFCWMRRMNRADTRVVVSAGPKRILPLRRREARQPVAHPHHIVWRDRRAAAPGAGPGTRTVTCPPRTPVMNPCGSNASMSFRFGIDIAR